MIQIRQATSETDFNNVARFYRAFADWLNATYPEMRQSAEALEFLAELEAEIESLPGVSIPPGGRLLIATFNSAPAGTVAMADLGHNRCEMRRMFVESQYRGAKIGRALANSLIAQARERGYVSMHLSTLPRHYAALALYRSLGFKEVDQPAATANFPPDLPDDLKRGIIFMHLAL